MSKRALANHERELQMRRLKRQTRSLLLLVATLLSVATAGLLAADQLYRPDAFAIEELNIKGRLQHVTPTEIEAIVKHQLRGNFFSVQLDQIERRIEQLDWVQNAEIRRQWPNKLMITIEEQRPVVRWGDSAWVNVQGQVVELPAFQSNAVQLTLRGQADDAAMMLDQSLTWKQHLAEHNLTLTELSLSDRHAYQLQLLEADAEQPFELLLGNQAVEQRLQRFLALYDNQLRNKRARLTRVDARYPDGLAVKQLPQSKSESSSKPSVKSQPEPITP